MQRIKGKSPKIGRVGFWVRTLSEGWITVAALGISVTEGIADIVESNLARYRAGEPLLHLVDWGRGY